MKTKVDLNNKTILVTGSAGFIGFYLSKRLLEEIKGVKVIGFDSVNDYYDVVFLAIIKSVFGIDFSKFDSSSNSYKSVDQLINNTRTSFNNSDGTKIYQDYSGKTIGRSTYDEKTGETKYWNDKGIYIGKSGKDNSGTEKYWDSELKYKGQSEKNSNGTTSYYDENLKHKGISRDNSNDTTTFLKK